jgi:ATP-dependent Lon protease
MTLPVLALAHPLVLLPASSFAIPVSKAVGDAILELIDASDALPVVAAVPLTQPSAATLPPDPDSPSYSPLSPLAEWGTAARVLRLVKPPARNRRQPYLVSLHGLTRVKLSAGKDKLQYTTDSLPSLNVEYPSNEMLPNKEAVDKFKQAAFRLLDRLSRDAVQPSRKDGYNKIANMLDDITDARTPWMADVLAGSINTDYADKLGQSYTLFSRQQFSPDSVFSPS